MGRVVAAADHAALEARTRRGFAARFDVEATFFSSAPGRANLIGEHTDYNEGFVLPFAIARRTGIASSRRSDRRVCVASAAAPGLVEFDLDLDLDAPIVRGEPRWGDYVRGVVSECLAAEWGGPALDPGGFDAWIDSDVPVGAGLSSSAALEVALATLVEELAGRRLELADKAKLCRRAEQRYAGVPCGIMDQMVSAVGGEDRLLFLDCRDASWRTIALPADEIEIVVVDSGLAHDLGEGEFARRVEQCREAARRLRVASLRDATAADLTRLEKTPLLLARARHVVEENARVLEAVAAVESRDWPRLGELLDASHASLRDLYEVSRPEMDDLVQSLRRAGALGARMTGGGFGGCAVALFRKRGICAERAADG